MFPYSQYADVARFEADGWERLPALDQTHCWSALMLTTRTGPKPRWLDAGNREKPEMMTRLGLPFDHLAAEMDPDGADLIRGMFYVWLGEAVECIFTLTEGGHR